MYRVFVSSQNLLIRVLRQDEQGATAVEYGLILVFIAAVIAVVVKTMGTTVKQALTVMVGKF
jgi:pilus assembly protein Flp/PilA